MKVILLQDVANIGLRYEVRDVPRGHALNLLIPQKKALPATTENIKRLESRMAKVTADKEAARANFSDVAERIAGTTQTITMEANDKGHLFQGLKADDIASSLGEAGFAVTPAQVKLNAPIKEIGEHTITLADGDDTTTFTLNIVSA